MREWTEQEEQEMIDRAKAGEPEANYELSLWALARSEEEPEEPRWNRLAAKCLVKAAQAGYAPAQKQMAALLENTAPGPDRSARDNEPDEADEPPAPAKEAPRPRRRSGSAEPVSIRDARRAGTGKGPTSTARRPVPPEPDEDEIGGEDEEREDDLPPAGRRRASQRQAAPARRPRRSAPVDEPEEDEDYADGPEPDEYDEPDDWDDDRPARPARGGDRDRSKSRDRAKKDRAPRSKNSGGWGDAQWRRVELVCVFLCAVLLIAIAVMLFTGRHGGQSGQANSAIPPAGEAAPAAATDTPAPAGEYPDEDTRAAIEAAVLDIPPMEEDFRAGPTTATVSVNSVSLRLRKGPNTSYSEITSMPDGSKVEVFADKNDWSLVRYQDDEGPVYGWCSSTYLIIDAIPAAIG